MKANNFNTSEIIKQLEKEAIALHDKRIENGLKIMRTGNEREKQELRAMNKKIGHEIWRIEKKIKEIKKDMYAKQERGELLRTEKRNKGFELEF